MGHERVRSVKAAGVARWRSSPRSIDTSGRTSHVGSLYGGDERDPEVVVALGVDPGRDAPVERAVVEPVGASVSEGGGEIAPVDESVQAPSSMAVGLGGGEPVVGVGPRPRVVAHRRRVLTHWFYVRPAPGPELWPW
jgi:hypothetical protein